MAKDKIISVDITIDEGTTLVDENGVSYSGTVTVDNVTAEKLKSTGKALDTEAITVPVAEEITPAQIVEEPIDGSTGK